MSDTSFRVDQLDHVELLVPDRYEAARWYERVLGLAIVSDYEYWAQDPNGPLMISPDGVHSLHFLDPWGHRLEVTTYETEYVQAQL